MSRAVPDGAAAWNATYIPVPSAHEEADATPPHPGRCAPAPAAGTAAERAPFPRITSAGQLSSIPAGNTGGVGLAAPDTAAAAVAPPPPMAAPLGARACYFLLGAGLLAAWNALITATDYFGAVYPGWHTDRLFTVSYLPVCMVMLAFGIRFPNLPPPPARIRLGYIGFTAAMAAVPLVDALFVAPSGAGSGDAAVESAAPATAPVGGLVAVMLCVALVGACDGLCQGALFGEAAQLPPPYTQALVSGTASSGLLVCLLRLASKASFEVDAADRARGLRDGTRLYFALAGLLSFSCLIVYDAILPRLRELPSRGGPASYDRPAPGGGGGVSGSHNYGKHAYRHGYEHHPMLLPLPLELSKECRSGGGADVAAAAAFGSDIPYSDFVGVTTSGSSEGSCGGGAAGDALLGDHVACSDGGGGDGTRPQIRRCLVLSWQLCCSLFVTYTVTLSIFPGFLAEDVHSALLGDFYPILLITTFNAADLIGKSLPCLKPSTDDKMPPPQVEGVGPERGPPQRQPQQPQPQHQQGQWHGPRHPEHDHDHDHPDLPQAPLLLCSQPGKGTDSSCTWGHSISGSSRGNNAGGGGTLARIVRACGRSAAAALLLLRRPRGLLAASLLRGAAALPAFLVAARWQAPAWVMAALTAALGVSNGYLTAQVLIMGPAAAIAAAATAKATATAASTPSKSSAPATPARVPAGGDGGAAEGAAGYHPLPEADCSGRRSGEGACGPRTVAGLAMAPVPGPSPGQGPEPGLGLPSGHGVPALRYVEPPTQPHLQPHLQPHPDAEVVETLLVLSLVAGLNAGAYLGWLWLLG